MKAASASRYLSIIFLITVISTVVLSNLYKPRVMILHSYSPDYSWTKGVNVGLRRVTEKWANYAVVWHYMDTKKRNDKDWLRRAGVVARQAIEKWEPDVLIAVDNLAQDLAAKYYVNDPHMSIVFAGINGSIEPYGYRRANNVTGILELRPLDGLRQTILSLEDFRRKRQASYDKERAIRILYVIDSSNSVLGDKDYVDHFDWRPLEYVGSFVAKDWRAWKEVVLSSAARTDYIFVTNYRQLSRSGRDPRFVPANEVMTWTEEHSPVPVIGLQVFNVEDGAMLAVGQSPYEQGEVAARMAEDILKNRAKAKDIPIVPNKHYIVAIRRSAMERRKMELPEIYESFARATDTYFE